MYRTDKQFMTNPATASSRIYIGGIPKTVVASDLEEKFRNYGKILGLVLQMGFAFIQYEHESQAQAAIRSEVNSMLHGRKITVKQALDKSQKGANNQRGRQNQNQNQNFNQNQNQNFHPNQNQNFNQNQNQGPPPHQSPQFNKGPHNQQPFNKPNNEQQQSHQPPPKQFQQQQQQQQQQQHQNQQKEPQPLLQQQQQPPPQKEPPKETPPNNPPQLGPSSAPIPPQSGPLDEPAQNRESLREREINKNDAGPPEKRPRKRRIRSKDRFPGNKPDRFGRDDSYYGREDYPPPPSAVPYNRAPLMDQPDRNDCEIIVVSKLLTKYAEYIEQRLKASGLIVDLLFPNEDVPIGRVLANISSRGCLYAILIMPQNEEHRSLTLNILHGIPQEHRNMPIEDAFVLLTRNFDAYMRGDRSATETLGPGGVMNISDRHPTSMQLLLNLLAENRQITSAQYDKLLKYLQDRKEVQVQHEVTEGVDQSSQESNSKQAELQSRIMNILNKSNDNPPPPPPVEPPQKEDVAPPLLKDPSVQKALDSLLGGDMFKNIAGGF